MSLIKRLVHRRFHVMGASMLRASHEDEVRFLLNAIADELEREEINYHGVKTMERYWRQRAYRWLRSQCVNGQ